MPVTTIPMSKDPNVQTHQTAVTVSPPERAPRTWRRDSGWSALPMRREGVGRRDGKASRRRGPAGTRSRARRRWPQMEVGAGPGSGPGPKRSRAPVRPSQGRRATPTPTGGPGPGGRGFLAGPRHRALPDALRVSRFPLVSRRGALRAPATRIGTGAARPR
jgi:hypothetical protein